MAAQPEPNTGAPPTSCVLGGEFVKGTRDNAVDVYLAALPADQRSTLEVVRATIRRAIPDGVEAFAYGLPAFRYRGRPVVYFGAARNHCALYGMSEVIAAHQADLARYETSKGAIRFPCDRPPPAALVRKLVRARMRGIDATADQRRKR
jgi:uncharacterized protein YdhG (YjbR/CyaY superfamily)